MSVLDVGMILVLIMCLIMGFKKGAIKEAFSLVGIVLVFIISFYLMKPVGSFFCEHLPFFNYSGSLDGLQSANIIVYQLTAFVIIFSLLIGIYVFMLKISGVIERLVDLTIVLLLPSKLLGALISFITGYLIIFIVLLVLLVPFKEETIFKESKLIPMMLEKTPIISKQTEKINNCIEEIYNLDNNLTTMQADVYTINLMLKYDIVSEQTIKNLIEKKKLTNTIGINFKE